MCRTYAARCVILIIGNNATQQGDRMTRQFDKVAFDAWRQDTQDYSMITDKDVYLARLSNDCITYCVKVLGTYPLDAYKIANNLHIAESKRLGV